MRTFHTDDRTFANFQPPELRKLCGVGFGQWPLYVAKELIDNALAVVEERPDVAPVVTVTVSDHCVEVRDTGPGLSDAVLDLVLDFARFGGSNRHHKLPTRGAQGNALMTIVGVASAWGTPITVGRPDAPTLRLETLVDQVRQTVQVGREAASDRPEGAFVRVGWPKLPWKRGGTEYAEVCAAVAQVALLNPHVSFAIRELHSGRSHRWSSPRDAAARPALPPGVRCGAASWFSQDEFADRLAADVRARPDLPIGDWLGEFMGCRPGGSRLPIGDVVDDDRDGLIRLAGALRKQALEAGGRVDDPKFAPIGADRLRDVLVRQGADPAVRPEYSVASGTFLRSSGLVDAVVPYLVEVCLVQMPESSKRAPQPVLAMNRTVLYGSPAFNNLMWREKVRGEWRQTAGDLGALARAYQIDVGSTPAALIVHVTCPSPGYQSYGKQMFDTDWLGPPLSECAERVTMQVRKQRAGESKRSDPKRGPEDTIKACLFRALPGVLDENTEGGLLPIMIRQLYYATRKGWERHSDQKLEYATFCAYVDLYERSLGHAVCLKDPRGTLIEPHSGRELRLGTDAVAKFKPHRWEGHTIVFCEKEGFAHLLKAYGVTKRYDAIIVGSKGFAVESCREVLQKYRKLLGDVVKIVALHDADPAGYMIGHDLATNLPRFGENVDVRVIDVGLTIREAEEMRLQDEPFELARSVWSMVRGMRLKTSRDGLGRRRPLLDPEAWNAFMPGMYRTEEYPTWADHPRGRRVELNSMPPRTFIEWLEGHLEANQCKKVRPPNEIVDETLRGARENAVRREAGELFMRLLGDDVVTEVMREVGVPAYDLDAVLAMKPEQHWEYLVKRAGDTGQDVGQAVERVMRRKMPTAFDGR